MQRPGVFFLLTAVLGVAGLGATLCDGRVFLRTGRSGQAAALADELGGKIVYETRARINGGKGDLAVISLSSSFPEAARQLARSSSSTRSYFFAGEQMGTGLIIEGDIVTRLFLMAVPAAAASERTAACLLISIRQSAADYTKSLRPPAKHLLEGAPIYPGSVPVNFWEDEKARLAVEVSQSGDRPAAIADFYAGALKADGWTPAPPGAGALAAEPGSLFYARGNRLCCVAVRATGDSGSLITVLHKQIGNE